MDCLRSGWTSPSLPQLPKGSSDDNAVLFLSSTWKRNIRMGWRLHRHPISGVHYVWGLHQSWSWCHTAQRWFQTTQQEHRLQHY